MLLNGQKECGVQIVTQRRRENTTASACVCVCLSPPGGDRWTLFSYRSDPSREKLLWRCLSDRHVFIHTQTLWFYTFIHSFRTGMFNLGM